MKVRYHKPLNIFTAVIIDQFNYALTLLDKYKAIIIIYKDGDIEELKKNQKLSDLKSNLAIEWSSQVFVVFYSLDFGKVYIGGGSNTYIYLVHESSKIELLNSGKDTEIPYIELVNRLEWIEDKVKKTAYSTYLPYIKISNLNG